MDQRLMTATSFKRVLDLVNAGRFDEAETLLRDLQDEYVSLYSENEQLREQISEVTDVLDLAETMEYDGQKYWITEHGEKRGPYCQLCYDREGVLVRLQRNRKHWQCCSCNNIYLDPQLQEQQTDRKTVAVNMFRNPIPLFGK